MLRKETSFAGDDQDACGPGYVVPPALGLALTHVSVKNTCSLCLLGGMVEK